MLIKLIKWTDKKIHNLNIIKKIHNLNIIKKILANYN